MEKKTIVFCAYREWALEICKEIEKKFPEIDFRLFDTEEHFEKSMKNLHPDLIFFVGWSWIIPNDLAKKFKCICLHPSPLPKYRGGSPIQHQIINGEDYSAVSLFLMNEFIDKGPILWQKDFSLDGELNDVFNRIIKEGIEGISVLIKKYLNTHKLKGTEQDLTKATYFKRRTPDQSEIKVEDFKKFTAKDIYNKIRALQDPYPNAFIICKDGTKLFLTKAKVEE